MQNLDKQKKLPGQTTMLIMELEWHAFSPKLAAKLTLPICAVQIGMLQTTTNERWKTEVM
jgi:hypothetical protein